MSQESPYFGGPKLRFDQKRLSKLTQEDVRSIKTIDYSPSLISSREGHTSPNMKKVKSTMNTFRLMHKEEANSISRSPSQAKSSKDVKMPMKISKLWAK